MSHATSAAKAAAGLGAASPPFCFFLPAGAVSASSEPAGTAGGAPSATPGSGCSLSAAAAAIRSLGSGAASSSAFLRRRRASQPLLSGLRRL